MKYILGIVLSLLISVSFADNTNIFQSLLKPVMVTQDFDKTKPLVIDTPLTFEYAEDLEKWTDIEDQITKTQSKDITLNVEGFGGRFTEASKFIQVLQKAKLEGKQIKINVIGPSYSCHAFVACYGSTTVTIQPGASLMFHAVYREHSWLVGAINFRDTVLDKAQDVRQNEMLFDCMNARILNTIDLKVLKQGDDVYISNEYGKITKTYTADDAGPLSTLKDVLTVIIYFSLFLVGIILFRRAWKQ